MPRNITEVETDDPERVVPFSEPDVPVLEEQEEEQEEDAPSAVSAQTAFGSTKMASTALLLSLNHVRALINDAQNRIKTYDHETSNQETLNQLLSQWRYTPSDVANIMNKRWRDSDGVVQDCKTTLRSLKQAIDTHERLIRQQ